MRTTRVFPVSAFLIAGMFTTCARAQTDSCDSYQFGQFSMSVGLISQRIVYSAIVKTTFEQKLYDGNTIRYVTESREAHDSAGRTRTESRGGCGLGEDGQMHSFVTVNVHDPVARTSMNWQQGPAVQTKTAHVFHQPNLTVPQPRTRTPEEVEQQKQLIEKLKQASVVQRAQQRTNFTTEDLGTKQINGMTAKGSRTTETIAAGVAGNDLPLVVVNETWTSVNVRGLVLVRINDDPRRGRRVTEFEELKLGEPDPALFSPPADYKVDETTFPAGIMSGIAVGTLGVPVQ